LGRAISEINRFIFSKAHHVDISSQEDRCGAAGKMGASKGSAEEGGLEIQNKAGL
jgi:hypothetical protein